MVPEFSLTFLSPLVLVTTASLAVRRGGSRPGNLPQMSEVAALASLALSVLGLLQFLTAQSSNQTLINDQTFNVLRADVVSLTMTLLVAFIGWVVVRYSRTYLDGEPREGRFHGLMLVTLAAVLVFIQSANLLVLALSSIAVGLSLRRLLLFYAARSEAVRAARKFCLVWHSGDVLLVLAGLMLLSSIGTVDTALIAAKVANGYASFGIIGHIAVGFVVLASILKAAAFPFHGWLTEVMEAPTPVSALLHAGIINAGGVLLIKNAELVQSSPGAMATLAMIGGLTALFGAAVMLTQSAIKTSLAWSTVSQMGFLIFQCGLGLWALALLHIVAHSLYKAHAFLSSGGAVVAVDGLRRPGKVAVPGFGTVLKSFVIALMLYGVIAVLFTLFIGPKTAQALALGAILIFGVAYLIAQGLADQAPVELTKRTIVASLSAAVAYFSFQEIAQALWGPALPAPPVPGPLEWALVLLALISFGFVALAQALCPLWSHHPATTGLRVHLANGLYLNALLDRTIGGFRTKNSK